MKHYLSLLVIAILLLLAFQPAEAMEQTVGLRGGLSYPLVDINENNDMNLMLGASYEAWLKDYLSIGIAPYYTKLSADDPATSPNMFESTVIGADIQAKLRAVDKGALNFKQGFLRRISPFVSLGLGVGYSDLETNLSDPDGKLGFVLPTAGVGISFQTKWNVNFDLGVQAEHPLTDKFEDLEEDDLLLDGYLMPYLGIGYTFGKKDKGSGMSTYKLLRDKISMTQSFTHQGVQFDFDSANLTPSAMTILDQVVDGMKKNPSVKFDIQGHTDSTGSKDYNYDLSLRRADAVKTYMVGKGIAAERLQTHGYGPDRPVATNTTDEGRQMNRRIEFVIMK